MVVDTPTATDVKSDEDRMIVDAVSPKSPARHDNKDGKKKKKKPVLSTKGESTLQWELPKYSSLAS
jgi:hypothetical protein